MTHYRRTSDDLLQRAANAEKRDNAAEQRADAAEQHAIVVDATVLQAEARERERALAQECHALRALLAQEKSDHACTKKSLDDVQQDLEVALRERDSFRQSYWDLRAATCHRLHRVQSVLKQHQREARKRKGDTSVAALAGLLFGLAAR
jgi:hypothetical protein